MAEFFALGSKLLTSDKLMDLFYLGPDTSDKQIDKNFDLNSKWQGAKFARYTAPKNGTNNWCLYLDFEVDGYNRIQVSLDIKGALMTRSFSGGGYWSNWKQIGGVTRPLLTHVAQGFSRLFNGKAVLA